MAPFGTAQRPSRYVNASRPYKMNRCVPRRYPTRGVGETPSDRYSLRYVPYPNSPKWVLETTLSQAGAMIYRIAHRTLQY
jgi:hypothetical protein